MDKNVILGNAPTRQPKYESIHQTMLRLEKTVESLDYLIRDLYGMKSDDPNPREEFTNFKEVYDTLIPRIENLSETISSIESSINSLLL
jgi:hypothetical protein